MQDAAVTKDATASALPFPIPANVHAERVVSVTHYTDRLFSFRITRPQSLRFRSGEFVMIGLPNAEKPVYRAYSVASPAWDDELEFYSIKVQDGPLTQHLQKIQPGDIVLLRPKPTGTLVLDALTPGKRVFMIATGTGIAPFASLIREPETYDKFEQVILTNTCRDAADLQYGNELAAMASEDPLIGEMAGGKLVYYATTTREETPNMGRITTLIENGKLFSDLGIRPLDPATDRVMLCGSMAMIKDVAALLEARGFTEGSNSAPAEFVLERAFVG
ncbi:ferredoxin--NADP reductase [Mesorhizobium australicum]|uniref:ferredoxin--NADP(+) reductase n=1 Tax=Mesorhizobium australicum TaxID=536018 RepID=A0A1X7NKW2_9HYPH|nr:ferredoxin--NADP reductase [Mesorhizobium australicum]SMH37908.1 ferredoxin--NADP+ reductase [Mesorhizobium australicum]